MESSYDDVPTEEILERSGVSRGALYHHFPTKLDLFRAVFMASEQRVIERTVAGMAVSQTPFKALLHLARGYMRAAETDEELRRIGLCQAREVLGWEAWREAATGLGIGVALAGVTAAIEAGELPPRDPEATAMVLLGAMMEAATMIVFAEDPAEMRARCEAVVVDVLEGLRR